MKRIQRKGKILINTCVKGQKNNIQVNNLNKKDIKCKKPRKLKPKQIISLSLKKKRCN